MLRVASSAVVNHRAQTVRGGGAATSGQPGGMGMGSVISKGARWRFDVEFVDEVALVVVFSF